MKFKERLATLELKSDFPLVSIAQLGKVILLIFCDVYCLIIIAFIAYQLIICIWIVKERNLTGWVGGTSR